MVRSKQLIMTGDFILPYFFQYISETLYPSRADDVIWCKDCGFVGCMNKLDPSHYIFSSYGIVVISVTYCVFNYIHNIVMSLQILRKVAVMSR